MVAIPSADEEDDKRPNRERECLVAEQSRLINRMKSVLVLLGIRSFNPKLKGAADQLETLRTPEGRPIPPNTLAGLKRDLERRAFICDQIRRIEEARAAAIERAPDARSNVMIRLLARVVGIGIETADVLVREVLGRTFRDRRAVGRYGGLTGSPASSGTMTREQGLAKSGNARVRRTMVQLGWRFLLHQKDSSLAQWYQRRTASAPRLRKTLIVGLG